MELLDDKDVETMVVLYYPLGRLNPEPIQLFAELADVKPVENVTQLSQQLGVEDLCTEVPKLFMHDFDIDLNVGCLDVIEIDALGEDGSDNNDCSDHECEDFSDPDLDDVPDDIHDEG
ncbi:hypothetical protein GOBAR_AA02079 [Gossypium barbadense]|uniref:Uncharacterized protein n=1 Tax=Gossypium barbadense TaxID=3634 RepID=A0A2P5YSD1_GOSBA|nr:hypothetical protein GOBAR_AA02079 [Gossypium barbadense]